VNDFFLLRGSVVSSETKRDIHAPVLKLNNTSANNYEGEICSGKWQKAIARRARIY
jgi:hypothetical protein